MREKLQTTKGCLEDYFERFKTSEVLAEFAKVTPKTERRWRHGEMEPQGETLIRIRYFLAFLGYDQKELREIPEPVKEIGQCIALDLITVDEATKEVEAIYRQRLFGYLRGEVGMSKDKLDLFAALNNRLSQTRKQKADELAKTLQEKVGLPIQKSALNHSLIEKFAGACRQVREMGNQLLAGPVRYRIAMRQKIGVGSEPELHLTWEVLNKLLNER